MRSRSPIVDLEDAIGTQLLLAQMGRGGPPTVAGRYRILELRGRGASGLVCKALDTRLHRQVALKLYPPFEDARLERETLREAQALALLEHPNVVRIYDHDQGVVEAGRARLRCLFVSMEFIEGRHLKAWLAEAQRSPNEILRALSAAGDGLLAAHSAGLIHRDFKPENVMIDVNDRVRVVDFGLARGQGYEFAAGSADSRAPSSLVSERITQAGVAPGTPEYMAPEAMSGHASASSDQFSFAASAWESLTGQLPPNEYFPSSSQSGAEVDPANKLPKRLRSALERALADDPRRRYPSLAELLDELRRVSRRGRRWAIGGVSLALVVTLFVAGWAFRADTLEQAAEVSSARTEADAAAARCSELAGLWLFDTVVVWANDNVRWYGATGHYELELESLDGCSMNAHLKKTGDGPRRYSKRLVREGARGVLIEPSTRGLELSSEFLVASEKFGKLSYDFNIVFTGDELRGDFQYTGGDGVVWKGILRGGRVAPSATLAPDARLGLCASQCRIRCPSPTASDECIAKRCFSDTTEIADCGQPGADAVLPPLTQVLAGKSLRALRAELGDPDARDRCTTAARAISGLWRVSSPTSTQTMKIRALGCELDISARKDEGAPVSLRGLTTATGAWVIAGPGSDTVDWALVGWDPAFGVTREGQALVAHRSFTSRGK